LATQEMPATYRVGWTCAADGHNGVNLLLDSEEHEAIRGEPHLSAAFAAPDYLYIERESERYIYKEEICI